MDREKKELRKRRTSGHLRSPELKRQKQRNPYVAARSTSPDCNFWDNRQKELYDQICREKKVFKHRFVEWSDIADAETCPFDLSTKYEDLDLKGLTSNNSSWVWNEDVVRQFYGTLYIDPDRREMHFMIGSQHYFATKEDLEKALLIEPRADSLVLHTWDDVDVYSLFRVPNPDIGLVRDLKAEVDLIQRINRHTIYPKSGNRGGCTTMLLKLASAIYHGKQFDIAHFLLSEMCEAIDTQNHALPYAPYIFCLLRHLKCDPTNIDTKCCLKKYTLYLASLNREQRAASAEHEVIEVQHQQPMSYSHQPPQPVNPDSTVSSNAQLSKLIEGLHEKVVKGFEAIEKRLYTMEVLFSVLSSEVSEMKACMLDPCHARNGDKQKRAQTEAHQGGDGSSAAADP